MSALANSDAVIQIESCIHQCNVREGLREVADQAFALWIVLLREQAKVVAERKQAIEQHAGVVEDGQSPSGC